MKGLDLFYLQDIAKQYAIGMESYPEDNEEHKKNIFIALLKFSHKIGHPISSNEDFQEIQDFFQKTIDKPGLDAQNKLVLKQLKKDIHKYYPKLGSERLQKKQTVEAEKLLIRQRELQEQDKQQKAAMAALFNLNNENLTTLKQEHTTTKTVFNKMRNIVESANILDIPVVDGRYISGLRASTHNIGAIEQLRKIEDIIETNSNHGITQDRLNIKSTGIIIDGYVIPSKLENLVRQSYKDIKENADKMLNPGLAQVLLKFFGKLTNQAFTRVSIDEIQLNETGGKDFINKMNTSANKETIKTIAKVLGFNGTIPMYVCGNQIIRMDIQNGESGFSYHNSKDVFKNCIVPLAK